MKKRYVIYLFVLLLFILGLSPLQPVLPFVQVPGEIWPFGAFHHWEDGALGAFFGDGFTNTTFSMLVVFFVLIIMAFRLRARSKTADEVPSGFYNVMEMVIEGAYDYVVSTAGGKWARPFFMFFMTFVLWILFANWMALIPGMDSIGYVEDFSYYHPDAKEYRKDNKLEKGFVSPEIFGDTLEVGFGACRQDAGPFILLTHAKNCTITDADGNVTDASAAKWQIVPYARPAASDLNFTFALALISVIMTQYYGMRANGMRYWSKFFTWNTKKILESPLGVMDTVVGILEFVSEVFKIVSFAFRLFGAVFAGMVLLFVIGNLLPVGNLLFYFLEFAVGALQAGVLALLTLIFMSGAVEEPHH